MISDENMLELEGELDKRRKAQEIAQTEVDNLNTTLALWLEERDRLATEIRALEIVTGYTEPTPDDKYRTFGEG